MEIIFDIDGTLANASHRIHLITDPDKAKDWENFLSDEQVAKDTAIEQTWFLMAQHLEAGGRILFITGRPERQRLATWTWLTDQNCPHRSRCSAFLLADPGHRLYMRKNGDRRASHIVKGELLEEARLDGFQPRLVFEDRKDDAKMWREKGLLCCQVAEGNY